MKVVSNTIVKNGMPFIGKVLEQVIPFVDKCVVTISRKCTDGTNDVISDLASEYPGQFDVAYEVCTHPAELTFERQAQIYRSNDADWILFLDDDDYWPTSSLVEMIKYLELPVPGIAVSPYRVIDSEHYDWSWRKKWFTKWFRNNDINYRGLWPRDLIYTRNEILYWRQNKSVKRVNTKFYHLDLLKDHSFRNEGWAWEFSPIERADKKALIKFKPNEREVLNEIYTR